jgi:hypothetical protein
VLSGQRWPGIGPAGPTDGLNVMKDSRRMNLPDPLATLADRVEPQLGHQLTLLPIAPQQLLVTWTHLLHGAVTRGDSSPSGNGSKGGDHTPAEARAGDCCLRVYDISDVDFQGDNGHRTWSYDLHAEQAECVVDLDRPGLVLCAELIRVRHGNGPQTIARSRRLRMPQAAAPATNGGTKWLICDR